MPTTALVHVVDDDPAVRDSLAFLFAAAGAKAETYDSPLTFLERAGSLGAGCIVTDVRMPEMSGLEMVRRLKAMGVDLPVIVITGHGDVPLAVEAMKAGAVDFLEKPFDDGQLLAAVKAALAPASTAAANSGDTAVRARVESLSQRERQVLERLVDGEANKVVALALGISPRTVEIYRAKVMAKMGAESFAELVRIALQAGVVGPRSDDAASN